MTTDEKIMNFCRYCDNRSFGFEEVMLCRLTRKPPEFDEKCENYKDNAPLRLKILRQESLEPRARAGKRKTILLCLLFGLLSIGTFIFSLRTFSESQSHSLMRSIIRMGGEFFLMYGIYIGNRKIKIIVSILLFIAIVYGLVIFFRTITETYLGLIFIPMIALYGFMLKFINLSEDYAAFAELQSDFYD
jgi:hypothetical protein